MDLSDNPDSHPRIARINRTIIERNGHYCHHFPTLIDWFYASIALGAVAIILNVYVIIAVILKQRKLRWSHKPSLLVLSLAFADLILGISCLLANALPLLLTEASHLALVMDVDLHIIFYSLLNSLLHIFSMTVERFLAIRFPFIYKEKMTNKKVLLMILATWVLSFFYLFMLVDTFEFLKFLSILIFGIGILLLMIYVYVFYKIRKIMTQRRDSSGQGSTNNILKRELMSAIYCVTVVLAFILCSFPNAVNNFRVGYCDYLEVDVITTVVMIGNTIFNPLLWILSEKCMGKQRKTKKHIPSNKSVSLSVISNPNQKN